MSTIKKVEGFLTSDGKFWETTLDAAIHEQKIGLINLCLSKGWQSDDALCVANFIAENWHAIDEITSPVEVIQIPSPVGLTPESLSNQINLLEDLLEDL